MSFRYLQFIHTGQTRSVCQSHLAKCVQRGGTVRLSLKPWRNVLAFHCPWIIPSTYSTKEHKSALCTQSFPLQQRLSTAVIEKREGGFTANLKQDCSLLLVNTISSSLHYSATFILFLSLSLSFSRGKKKRKKKRKPGSFTYSNSAPGASDKNTSWCFAYQEHHL